LSNKVFIVYTHKRTKDFTNYDEQELGSRRRAFQRAIDVVRMLRVSSFIFE